MSDSTPDPGPDLSDYPAFVGEVYREIAAGDGVPRQALLEEMYYAERTIDEALHILESDGHIRRDRRSEDLRTVLCTTCD